jgi:ferric-dicitrate binding protein FerR (iron transport regulator)
MTRAWLLAALLVAAVSGCDGCDGCAGESEALASLVERRGEVQRDFAKSREQWLSAEPGAEFRLGDGMRTEDGARAQLEFVDGSRLDVHPNTTVRFLVDGAAEGERSLDVITGEATLYAGTKELRLRTHVGMAIINPGSRLLLTRLGMQLSISLEVGSAHFRDAEGHDVVLSPGERVTLQVGMAVLRKSSDAEPDASKLPPRLPAADAPIEASVLHEGVRARTRGSDDWRELPRGQHDLQPGTGLRLLAGGEVDLSRGAERARLLGAGEYVLGEAPTLLEAARGNVHVIAQAGDVEVRVPGGRIVARAADGGSEAELRVDEEGGTLDVQRGSATFSGEDGVREVSAGKSYRWTHGAKPGDESEADGEAPDYANLEVRVGESFVVHAPQLPIALSFDFDGKCKERGLVEVAQPKRRSSGVGHANLLLAGGARGYTLRCVDARGTAGRVVARGTAHVLQDAGTRQLPLRAPSSLVDADGRSYTIYYQNQLPELRVRWPNAPKSDNYVFDVDGTSMSVPEPEYVFQSGTLRDGVHRLTFRAQERRSRTANVEVKFDNTTATASLSAPADRAFKAGDTVSIEGVVLPAWKVSVRDGTIEKVGADRFQGQVVTSSERPDIAVRLAHPRLGTHYYLRRAVGSR